MIRMALKVLVGLALSATLTALLSHVGVGRAMAGDGSDSSADQVALLSR